jgi:hypothetical protein
VVLLGPKANAEVILKFYVALHASHAALPKGTLNVHPNTALSMLISKFRSYTVKLLFNFSPLLLTTSTSEPLYFSLPQTYPHHRDEWALPGIL